MFTYIEINNKAHIARDGETLAYADLLLAEKEGRADDLRRTFRRIVRELNGQSEAKDQARELALAAQGQQDALELAT